MTQNIWILTIGSSDVHLISDHLWCSWKPEIEDKLEDCPFKPTEIDQITWGNVEEDPKTTYRLPARVLGLAYNALPDQVGKYLTFPLLEKFAEQLKAEDIIPTKILVILTNQHHFFTKEDKAKGSCPYWQDTCFLKRALKDCFFGSDAYGLKGVEVKWVVLSPQNNEDQKYGLDDWNGVLGLVKNKLSDFKRKQELKLQPGDRVYVSHQAGTPAISSAVQFACLAEFEQQFKDHNEPQQTVRFLVSNEYNLSTKPIESSEYLRGIRKQEALALLKRYDYSGIKSLIFHYLKPADKLLLEAAIQWNYAEFEEFARLLLQLGTTLGEDSDLVNSARERTTEKNWWWTAYEATYLALVRFRQGNTVEAIFHSFRAVEGLLRNWVDEYYLAKQLKEKDPRKYIHSKDEQIIKCQITYPDGNTKNKELQAFGKDLYWFIIQDESISKNEDMRNHIIAFGERIFDRRNELFHQLKGLYQLDKLPHEINIKGKEIVFNFWEITSNSEHDWMNRVIGCLNFISNQNYEFLDFGERENSNEQASLMAQVHQELTKAIDSL